MLCLLSNTGRAWYLKLIVTVGRKGVWTCVKKLTFKNILKGCPAIAGLHVEL